MNWTNSTLYSILPLKNGILSPPGREEDDDDLEKTDPEDDLF